jgi:hypothetical protein
MPPLEQCNCPCPACLDNECESGCDMPDCVEPTCRCRGPRSRQKRLGDDPPLEDASAAAA